METTNVSGVEVLAKDAGNGARGSVARLAENFDSFLTLLTTQLQNQDPTSPMETNEFTNQLVQFASVEQQVQSNEKLDSLVEGQQLTNNAVGYLGKEIKAKGTSSQLSNSQATFFYDLSTPADRLDIGITDANGQIVYSVTQEGDTASGPQTFEWNGRDSSGNPLPDGNYDLIIRPTFAGREVGVSTFANGTVTGVDFSEGNIVLLVGSKRFPLDQVDAVYEPKPKPVSTEDES